jgi:CDP-paratose 2-epimerase
VDDLLDVYDSALANINTSAGKIFNIGGGPQATISIWKEFCPILESMLGYSLPVQSGDWRPGDQRIYVSDIRKAERELAWKPRVDVKTGIRFLFDWVKENQTLFN